MIFVLCYPRLNAADAEAIEAFRREHEPERAKMVRAHVTLVFGVRSLGPEALRKIAEPIASTTPAFDIALDSLSVEAHEQGSHNLFLMIGEGSDRLVALNASLYAGALAPERSAIAFEPHITIATNADLRTVMLAAPDAKPLTRIKGRIEALHIAALDGASLAPIASLPLRG